MRVVVTRPEPEAGRWAAQLRARGLDAITLPLIEIAAPPDAGPLRQAWRRIETFRAVMFVSGNAARGFFAHRDGAPWPLQTRAWATGPGTRDALVAAAVPEIAIDSPGADAPQFDSEHLWMRVQGGLGKGDAVLIVRGGDAAGRAVGRDWLRDQLTARGVEVETVIAYERRMPAWSAVEHGVASRAASDGSVWLFSSSEAIENLVRLLPAQQWRATHAMVTHPRVAQAARAAGFDVVHESRPTLDAVVAALESAG